ncbi:MAG: phage holin family protein [Cyanobium sp.]
MHALIWLLQWPIRALILLFVASLPLGVEVENVGVGLLAAVVISLLSTLLVLPLRLLLSPIWAITSLGGLIEPINFLFGLLINTILFALAAWLIQGFRLRKGLLSAALGAIVYSVLSVFVLRLLHLEVPLSRAMTGMLSGSIA